MTIYRVRSAADAFRDEYRGNVTILLTTPQFVHPENLRRLALLPSATRVVVVEPSRQTLLTGQLPITGSTRALASGVSAPGCDYRPATEAGPSGVRRTRYGPVNQAAEQQLRPLLRRLAGGVQPGPDHDGDRRLGRPVPQRPDR